MSDSRTHYANMTGQSFRIENSNSDDLAGYDKWNPQQLAAFLTKAGLGDYSQVIIKHKISGRIAPLLTDANLKEMGISIVGDRLRIMSVVHMLGQKARYDKRTKTFWEGVEQLHFSEAERSLWTCFGCFPDDPSTYRLTSNHLRIKTVRPARIGPIPLCCCFKYSINNLDLSKINDVDVLGEPAPCCQRTLCCAPGRDHVQIMTPTETSGEQVLLLPMGEGEKVANMILHQVEEAQAIERD